MYNENRKFSCKKEDLRFSLSDRPYEQLMHYKL